MRRQNTQTKQLVHKLDTVGALVQVARQFGEGMDKWANSYFDGRTLAQACDYVMRGASDEETRPVRELVDKIDSAVHDRQRNEWTPEIQGAYAVVPEYLMGLPECMRVMTRQESDIAPLRILVESSLSSSLSSEATARRGAAIAALAMRLGEERPVELYVFKTSHTRYTQVCWMAKMDTHPVNAAQCMAVFGTEAFCRAVGWAYLGVHCPHRDVDSINFGFGFPGDFGRKDKIRKVFDLDTNDIIIEAGYAPDEVLIQRDPVAWVHKQLEMQRTVE